MKNCARYIICAISLVLTLSLIFEAFADDDRYRKRHRYRGGSEKIDYDNDDHDRNDYLKPVTNQTQKKYAQKNKCGHPPCIRDTDNTFCLQQGWKLVVDHRAAVHRTLGPDAGKRVIGLQQR